VEVVPALSTTLPLAVRRPFAADAMLGFLRTHTVPGVEYVRDRTYFRALRLPGGTGTVAVTLPEDDGQADVTATLRVDDPLDVPAAIVACRLLLDLDADPVGIDQVLAADRALTASVAALPGLRVPGAVDGPEMLIRAMLGQQVSVAGAQTAAARLVGAADQRLPTPVGDLTHLFPTPDSIAELGPGAIAGPRRRAHAVIAAAAAIADGSLDVSSDRSAVDVTADLVSRSGIGPWTAGYVAMRLGTDRDVLLTGDLVLRNGAALLGLPQTPSALAVRSVGWRPVRSYAGMHLWAAALAHRGGRSASSGRG
jgi:AraC family transcriptional regulator of adaptative response / DNA-3-methyladenine glycosylase II